MKQTTVSERALVLAPRGRDAQVAAAMLGEAGITAEACLSLAPLVEELNAGAAFVVVTEEAIATADLLPLSEWIDDQEEWSDLPFILLTNRGGGLERNPAASRYLDILGNVTFLERPFHPTTLVSLARSALRARRKQYEARARLFDLKESEGSLRFMSELDEALRASHSAPEAMLSAAELLVRALGVSRCAYADVDSDSNRFFIRNDARAPGIPTSAGAYSLDLFGPRAAADMRAGETLLVRDVGRELAPGDGREMFQSIGIDAIICCPLVKDGRLVAMMAVHQDAPRDWQDHEVSLIRSAAERCWSHVERIGAEERLRESEAKFHAIANSIDQMVWSTRPDGFHDYYNERWYDFTGMPRGSTDGDEWETMFHPDDRDRAWALWKHSLETGEPYEIEYRLRHRSGDYRWVLGRAQCVRDGEGQITRWFGTCTDIEEIVEAREVLTRSRAELEAAVVERTRERNRVWEMSADLFAIMGFDGFLKAINPAWETTLGRSSDVLLAQGLTEQVHPDDHAAAREVIETLAAGKSVDRFEDRLRHADGSWRWISWALVPEGDVFYAVGRDVTAEKQAAAELELAQEALRQAQKMEAMGQLTGGVAHDFNNLLTPIVGSLDLLQRKGLGSEREQRLIDGALQSAERARTLVQRLLAFARRQPLQPSAVDIAGLVRGMADLLSSTAGPQVRVVVDVADDLPPASADPNQLEMALLNLGVNARDAMPDGGTLRISALRKSIREDSDSLKAGHYVCLSVADTGFGMDEATLGRAVEPFFSTKGIGKGTGLGLSMAHGLAAQLGGALTIQSRVGVGTNIEFWLPVSSGTLGETQARPETQEVDGRARTALLVDDEDLVRASTADMLLDFGYRVEEAKSGEAALALVRNGARPDLLVSDHLMPGMTGVDLVRAAREIHPELPVLIVSGYAEADDIAPDLPRLTKPFRRSELAAKLAELGSSVANQG